MLRKHMDVNPCGFEPGRQHQIFFEKFHKGEKMGLSTSYLTSVKNLSGIFDAIKTAQAPTKFTVRFLLGLGFKSNSDRLIISVLKSLGFLTPESAAPTERYYRFLDQTQSAIVLAEAVRDAYSDLFQVKIDAHKLSKTDVVNKLKTLTQGKYSTSVFDKMGSTFVALCKLGDFETKAAEDDAPMVESPPENKEEYSLDKMDGIEEGGTINASKSFGGLHYNIQLILPESRDPKVYDALFRSLTEHLFK